MALPAFEKKSLLDSKRSPFFILYYILLLIFEFLKGLPEIKTGSIGTDELI